MMNKNTSILLGDHLSNFVDSQVKTGRFSSTSEVVRAGLRLLEEHEMAVERLRNELIDGENSGIAEPFDFDKFLSRKNLELTK